MLWIKINWIWLVICGSLLVGIVLLVVIPDEKQKVAWFAAPVATAGLFLSGIKLHNEEKDKERERIKKEEDSKEKLIPTVNRIFSPSDGTTEIQIKLHNAGHVVAAIEKVNFVVTAANMESVCKMACFINSHTMASEVKLEVKDSILFLFKISTTKLLQFNHDDFYIEVSSPERVILKVPGDLILPEKVKIAIA